MKLIKELLEDFLVEEPQRIKDLKIPQLEDPRLNKKLYRAILLHSPGAKVVERVSDDITLYQQNKNQEYEIYALDSSEKRIAYYVQFEVQNASFADVDWATQVLVWKGGITAAKVEGIAKKVFYEYVLPATGVVITDTQQTQHGERFWLYRIAEAFANTKYKIYLVNFHNKTIRRFKNRDEYEALLNTKNDPWGETAWHKGIRIAIADFDFIQE